MRIPSIENGLCEMQRAEERALWIAARRGALLAC